MSASQKLPDKPLMPQHAWQPFTPRGVAAFADATPLRLFIVQVVVVALVILALFWFLRISWIPVVNDAIQHLPDTGFIRDGELSFGGESPKLLAENRHLGVVVDLEGTRGAGQAAELEVMFEKNRWVVRGPLGNWFRAYDPNSLMSFNRIELSPWWGARRWTFLAAIAIAAIVLLFLTWWILAVVYLPLAKVIAFFADRGVTWRGAYRMNAAALLPGACLVALALVLYGFGAIDLFRFALLYALHLLAGLIFVITSPFFLPKLLPDGKSNPFHRPEEGKPPGPGKKAGSPFEKP